MENHTLAIQAPAQFAVGQEEILRYRDEAIAELKRTGCINQDEADRIRTPHAAPGIYFIPKIHKQKTGRYSTFAGRPMIAAMSGPLKQLDYYAAKLTTPLLKIIPGSPQDTADLLRKLEDLPPLSEKTDILFSADVEALYPSIPWEEGIRAALEFYAERFPLSFTNLVGRQWDAQSPYTSQTPLSTREQEHS